MLIGVQDPILRVGLETILNGSGEAEVVGHVGRAHEVRSAATRLAPAVVLLDVHFRKMDADLVPHLTRSGSRVVVLVDHSEDECALHQLVAAAKGQVLSPAAVEVLEDCCLVSLRQSAYGCVPKGASPERLLAAIRTVRDGEIAAAPWLRATVTRPPRRAVGPRPDRPITRRELEVIALIAEGLSNAEVGERLGIRAQTVKNHVNRIMGKLGVRNRLGIGLFAVRHKLNLRDDAVAAPAGAQRSR